MSSPLSSAKKKDIQESWKPRIYAFYKAMKDFYVPLGYTKRQFSVWSRCINAAQEDTFWRIETSIQNKEIEAKTRKKYETYD